jgi:hypothetical protein
MSTPTPSPEETPFDPHAFPVDLVDAQRELAEAYTALHTLQKRLPWSREPHPGWPDVEDRGRERAGRAASPGWDPADAAAYDKLWEDLREAAAVVQGHRWWSTCRVNGLEGAALVDVRQALKTAKGAVPAALERADVTAAA